MTSSGLWTPNRDSDPTLERGPIWYLLLDPSEQVVSRYEMVWDPILCAPFNRWDTLSWYQIPSQRWSHTMDLVVHMRYTPTGNTRVHGMIHHLHHTLCQEVSGGSQVGPACSQIVSLREITTLDL